MTKKYFFFTLIYLTLIPSILGAMSLSQERQLLKRDLLKPLGVCFDQINNHHFMQVGVPSQFIRKNGSKDEKDTSCAYHALRNGLLLAQAALTPTQAEEYIKDIVDRDKIEAQLAPNGDWRQFIKAMRNGAQFTDNLDTQELTSLINQERDKKTLNAHTIPVATYENVLNMSLDKSSNQGFIISDDLKTIQEKLNAQEDVTGIIIIRLHKKSKQSLAGVNNKELGNQLTPLGGHYITLLVHAVGNEHQYILADSACYPRLQNPLVLELIKYLEGIDGENITSHLAAIKTFPALSGNYGTYIHNITSSHKDSQLVQQSHPRENIIISFLYGALTGASIFIVHTLYKNYKTNTKKNVRHDTKTSSIEQAASTVNSQVVYSSIIG